MKYIEKINRYDNERNGKNIHILHPDKPIKWDKNSFPCLCGYSVIIEENLVRIIDTDRACPELLARIDRVCYTCKKRCK